MVCRLQKGFFRHALRKETTGRPADRLRQNKAVAEKKTAGSGGLKWHRINEIRRKRK